jgi:hypothetical protein
MSFLVVTVSQTCVQTLGIVLHSETFPTVHKMPQPELV